MSGIFISYRREDTAGHAGRLYDRLKRDFEDVPIFIDVRDIPSGDDWVLTIEKTMRQCDVCLVLIGRRWLTAADEYGQRKLDKADDWVRTEIGAALARGIDMIPVLVDGALAMPVDQALPGELVRLRFMQARPIRDLTFHQDVDLLIDEIKKAIGARNAPPVQTHTPGERCIHPWDGLEYIWIPPGKFIMGRVPHDNVADQRYAIEKPRHPVLLTRGFWMSRGPVTVRAYQLFAKQRNVKMPRAPSNNPNWDDVDRPIVKVTWGNANEYCAWSDGRLPTEAQWEYAARGGVDGQIYPWGDTPRPDLANYTDNPDWGPKGPSPVGLFPPNGFGLVDVVGNVWEWVSDWYDDEAYKGRSATQPTADPEVFVNKINRRVVRGGSWRSIAQEIRLSLRGFQTPEIDIDDFGFRCLIYKMPDKPRSS